MLTRALRRRTPRSLADELAAEGHAVIAVDYSSAAVHACQRRQDGAAGGGAGGAVYAVADATALPYDAGSFDAVLDKATLDVRVRALHPRCSLSLLAC